MKKRLAFWIPVALLCAAIFALSQDRFSGQHSDAILALILTLFHARTPQHIAELAIPFRKLAHILVYGLLSLLTYRGLSARHAPGFHAHLAVRSVVFSLLYSCSDEIHQIFVPGRGPAVHDVLLDGLAATVAMVLLQSWYHLRGRQRAPTPSLGSRTHVRMAWASPPWSWRTMPAW